MSWRAANAAGAAATVVLWVVATDTDWINSVRFVSHISMLTLVFTFVAAWRADVPDKDTDQRTSLTWIPDGATIAQIHEALRLEVDEIRKAEAMPSTPTPSPWWQVWKKR